jgi:hypothetical protein
MLLPHGYEGQGPEHSSARLERFLQLCAEGNMSVAYPSTPAQYFHILRRQARSESRRPLVLMQPKSLLRLPQAASRLEELANGRFAPIIDDQTVGDRRDEVQRVVFCTGKLFYDLTAGRADLAHRRPLSERDGSCLGAGRAEEHGRLELRGTATARVHRQRDADSVHRTSRACEPGRGIRDVTSGGAGAHRG